MGVHAILDVVDGVGALRQSCELNHEILRPQTFQHKHITQKSILARAR